jgi:hypothetical protein
LLSVERIALKLNESTQTTTARAEASTLALQIEPRIPTVTLRIATPAGAPPPAVTIDEVVIPEIALDAPRKVNPGAHVVVATLGGARTEARFTVAEAATRDVAVPYPVAPSVASPVPAAVTSPVQPQQAVEPKRHASRVPAYVALGVGGAGVVVTAVFGILALGDRSSLRGECGTSGKSCPARARGDINSMHSSSIVSDVGIGFAVVGLGVGGALLLWPRADRHASSSGDKSGALRVEPWVGLGAAGMRGSF